MAACIDGGANALVAHTPTRCVVAHAASSPMYLRCGDTIHAYHHTYNVDIACVRLASAECYSVDGVNNSDDINNGDCFNR